MTQIRHAVAVLIVTPQGIPLVRDLRKPNPCWKAPGGRSSEDDIGKEETARDVAIREVEEEIGISPPLYDHELTIVLEKPYPSHTHSLFVARRWTLAGIKTRGDGGEEIKIFSAAEILAMPDFLESHRRAYQEILSSL